MQNDHNLNDDDMPELNIRQENEFKKMKMNLEHGAIFPDEMMQNLPPEIEGAFLDSIINFEKAFKNAKRTTIAEKLNKTHFIPENVLNDAEIDIEIAKVQKALQDHNIRFEIIVEDEYSNREIYKFLTEDFMDVEIDDFQFDGMISCFNYEDYRPNHRYSLNESANNFINEFKDIDSNTYKDYVFENETVEEKITIFRNQFQNIELIDFQVNKIDFDENEATVTFTITFEALQKDCQKISFSGQGFLEFKFQDAHWSMSDVQWPDASNATL